MTQNHVLFVHSDNKNDPTVQSDNMNNSTDYKEKEKNLRFEFQGLTGKLGTFGCQKEETS